MFCALGSCAFVFSGGNILKTSKRLNEDEVNQLLIDSLVNNEKIETEELNERAENLDKSEDDANITEEYEEILRTKEEHHHCCVSSKESI